MSTAALTLTKAPVQRAPRHLVTIYLKEMKYEFLKNKAASLTLSVSDIFRSRVYDVYTTSASFNQSAFRRRDPQFFRLQFNWRFGKFDMSLFKRKNMKGEMESIQGGMQGGQQ